MHWSNLDFKLLLLQNRRKFVFIVEEDHEWGKRILSRENVIKDLHDDYDANDTGVSIFESYIRPYALYTKRVRRVSSMTDSMHYEATFLLFRMSQYFRPSETTTSCFSKSNKEVYTLEVYLLNNENLNREMNFLSSFDNFINKSERNIVASRKIYVTSVFFIENYILNYAIILPTI